MLVFLVSNSEPSKLWFSTYTILKLFESKITDEMHYLFYFVGAVPQGTATRLTTAAVTDLL